MRPHLIVGLIAVAVAVTTCGDDSGPSCSPANCPSCCLDGYCVSATTPEACGIGGISCFACNPGETCPAGWCEGGGACGPSTCSTGCCTGAGCQPGSAVDACGTGGGACTACSPGQICQAGTCRNEATCDSTTCATGCCSGLTCMAGNSNAACGTGGGACTACGGGQSCVSGICSTPTDPCGGVPTAGRCASTSRVEVCATPTGGGTPRAQSYDCAPGETCQMVGGEATCVLTAECIEGDTSCSGWDVMVCEGGTWNTYSCPAGCITSPLGDTCAPEVETTMLTAYLNYEARGPNDDWTGWSDLGIVAPAGFLVLSANCPPEGCSLMDAVYTGADGRFTVTVPTYPTAYDVILVATAGTRSDGTLAFVVAYPDFPEGTHVIGTTGAAPDIWMWSWRTDSVYDGSTITITEYGENGGSGAARAFDYLRYIYPMAESRWPGRLPGPLVVWVGVGVDWDCGACFLGGVDGATRVFDMSFDSQIWLAGGPDQGYWSDAVTAHELGHWAMETFGKSPNEGGQHCGHVATLPGQAWSEGWATWFSSDARGDPAYFDQQEDNFFWFSLDTRTYSAGVPWPRAYAWMDLLQPMSENEVSAMMWTLSTSLGGSAAVDSALSSPRMGGPYFARGYNRHTWDFDRDSCTAYNVEVWPESAPCFADFLDALVCGGVPASTIDAATEPDSCFPYPSGSPLCE